MGTKENPGRFDCYAAAAPDEPIFILRANDPLAPVIVRFWAELYQDAKRRAGAWSNGSIARYCEAMDCSEEMRAWKVNHDNVLAELASRGVESMPAGEVKRG
jgi:hypothetical protein